MNGVTVTKRKLINPRGISVVELILTIALMSILSATTLPLGIKFIQKSQLKNTRDTLVSYLNTSRSFAMSGKNNNNWGVNVTEIKITLFNGASFESRNISIDQEYEVPKSVTLTPIEIVFTKESGNTSGGTVDIYYMEGVSSKVTVDTQGNVSFN